MTDVLLKTLVQAIIGVGALALAAFLVIQGQDVPEELWAIITLILGFYFGAATVKGTGRST